MYITLFSRLCMTATQNPNFTLPLHGDGEHNAKIFLLFSNFRYGPFGFNRRKFWQLLTN